MAEKRPAPKKASGSKSRNATAANAALSRLVMYTSLRVEDLDAKALNSRLASMDTEIEEWKERYRAMQRENDWYRQETEACASETAEYTKYLEVKLGEKQGAIDRVMGLCHAELRAFAEKASQKEEEHQARLAELEMNTHELERKIELRQQEISALSDTLSKRARHEAEIARLQREIQDMEVAHQLRVSEIERELLQERMRLKRESDDKVQSLESQAHKNALNYLKDYTAKLQRENGQLETDLRREIQVSQAQEQRLALLTRQNQQLSREHQIREDLLQLRRERIVQAQAQRGQRQAARSRELHAARKNQLDMAVQRATGLGRESSVAQALSLTCERTNNNDLAVANADACWSDDDDDSQDYFQLALPLHGSGAVLGTGAPQLPSKVPTKAV